MNIFKQAEKLKWAMALPYRESIMLSEVVDEPRGSDYSKEYLERSIESFKTYDEEMSWAEQHGAYQDSNGEWVV